MRLVDITTEDPALSEDIGADDSLQLCNHGAHSAGIVE